MVGFKAVVHVQLQRQWLLNVRAQLALEHAQKDGGERGRREAPAAPPSPLRAPLARQNALGLPRPAVGFFTRPHSGSLQYCLVTDNTAVLLDRAK